LGISFFALVLGFVKNLAVVAYIIVGSAVNPILGVKFLEEWSIENFEEIFPAVIPNSTKIFVNPAIGGV
jgi:DNA-directed RNA polymerase II subunit RPB2